jgi:PAS domain S-box-containing protein
MGSRDDELQALREKVARLEEAQSHQATSVQLGLAVGLVGMSLWRIDTATQRIQLNDWGYEMIGERPRADGMPLDDLRAHIHPADHAALRQASEQAAASTCVVDVEARYRRIDGSFRTMLTRRVAERDARGRVVALVGVSLDISAQVSARDSAQEAAQSIDLIAEATGVGVWTNDIDSREVVWNRQMWRIYGIPEDVPVAEARRMAIELTDPADRQRLTDAFRKLVKGQPAPEEMEFRIRRHDGEPRWVVGRGRFAHHRERHVVLGVFIDITDRKRSEDVRREKAAAEEASRAKSEFLSRMSHELRTPLNAVLGFTQLILADPVQPLPDKQHERILRVRNAGQHLLSLIDDVLDLTSVEADSVPIATEPVMLAPLVQEMLQWLAPGAQQAGVVLSADALDGAVMADHKRLRQVLSNLLSNAIKYNRRGGRVDIALIDEDVADDESGRWLGFCVKDTGRGLTPAQMQRLFEPFNRLGAERDGIEGTGIGLTIVRALVHRMGGRIEVQSRPGEGSEFRVWLLRGNEGKADSDLTIPGLLDVDAASAADAPMDVLYIEDNPVNVLLVNELVAMRPRALLHVATDGRSGVARARALRPRAVLIDLQLPDIDGFEVLRLLRADPALQGLVCIALSANAMSEDIARAMRLGFDDYWTKPIDFARFLGGLDHLLQGG